MNPLLAVVLGLLGLGWGVVADRVAVRWPEHEAGVDPRGVDWRTIAVAAIGAASLAGVALRFAEPLHVVMFGAWAAVLVLLLATDLDQRLLPDLLTLPMIPIAAVVGLLGWNPLVADDMVGPAITAIVFPVVLYVVSIPFGPGAIGIGDLKLLVSTGLLVGPTRTFGIVLFGALVSGVVVVALLAARRISRRSYIPYGPFLIVGMLWVVLVVG